MVFLRMIWLMSIFFTTTSAFAMDKNSKVVVIGAGLAGLTTAYRLHQKGMEVHIYEARNRIGGRIFTAKIGSDVVELGGQNITDGGDAENILRFVDEFQLELTLNRINLNYAYFDGEKFISSHLLHKKKFDPEHLKLQLAQAVQKSDNMRDVLNELLEKEDPLYKTLSVRLAAYEGAPADKLSTLYTDTLYHMLLGGICLAHQSSGEEETYVDIVSIKGGNALLVKKLADSLEERVHLNMPLISIAKTLDGSYELIFQNGQKVKADIVVLAIPCSVYKDIIFEENLIPEERLESIKNVQYGSNAKILVPFSQLPSKKITFINDRIASFFADPNILTLYYTGDAGRFSENTIFEAYEQQRSMLEKGFGDLCPILSTLMFAVLYQGYVKPGRESEYQIAWSKVARYFVKERGTIGSCLHRTIDGLWIAYSRWPDKKTRDTSWGENARSNELPPEIQEAALIIKDCLDPNRKFPDICMEVVDDLFLNK